MSAEEQDMLTADEQSLAPELVERAGKAYVTDLKHMYATVAENPVARRAIRLASRLVEPNVLGIYRLCRLFDYATIAAKADEALRLHAEAAQIGPEAYRRESAVMSRKGHKRTPGGVFFWLMQQHAAAAGLRWQALNVPDLMPLSDPLPTLPAVPQPPTKKEKKPAAGVSQPVKPALQPTLVRATPANVSNAARPEASKPTRSKISITGTLAGTPRLIADRDIVELTLHSEASAALPKGIPPFGTSRVVAWCTRKQWQRVEKAQRLTMQTRFIIEGEPKAAVGSDLHPFMRVACLKLSTVEIEQAARAKSST